MGAVNIGTYSQSKAKPKVFTVPKKMMTQIRNGHREYLFKTEDVKAMVQFLRGDEIIKAVDKYEAYEISLASNEFVNEYFEQWAAGNKLDINKAKTIQRFLKEEKIIWV